jgi:hypothetical protein
MAQTVEVPGLGLVEFPESMTTAQIAAAIRRTLRDQPKSLPEETGAGQAALIAAGRATDKIVKGARQMYAKATGDEERLAQLAEGEADNDRLYAPLAAQHPVATAIGSAAPMLAVPVGAAGGAALIGRSALAGALPGALSYGSAGERAKAAGVGAVGGALGGALGAAVPRILKPAGVGAKGLSPEAVAATSRLGFTPTAGQLSQNQAMLNFENYLARSPGSAGAMQARQAAQQSAINRAGARSIGLVGDDLGEGAFSAAKKAIGSEFERLQQVTAPDLGSDFLNALQRIEVDNAARGAFRSQPVDTLVEKGLELAAQGKLTGKAYKEIRTVLTNNADSAFGSGDATLGQALKTVRKALDDAAKASLSDADKAAWDLTRQQWMAYKALTKTNVTEAGRLSAPRLAAELRRGSDAVRTGNAPGPLADVARIGEAIKGSANPNSGQLNQMMLYGNPFTGLPLMAGNKAAQLAYTSPWLERYLGQGLVDIGPLGQQMMGKAAGPAGIAGMRGLLGAEE